MRVYYDFGRAPPTFDFVSWLCGLATDREGPFDISLVPGPHDGFRRDGFWPHDRASRMALVENVVVPLAYMLPHTSSVTFEHVEHPPRPRYGHRVLMRAFRRGVRPLRARRDPVAGPRPFVTMTLREAEHWPERNSNLAAWVEAAGEIERRGLDVVVIRDTAKAGEPMERADPEAAIDLDRRAALYAGATLNLGVNNGPMWMAAAMDAPVAIFRPLAAGSPVTSEAYFRAAGMEPGHPHPWGAEHQTVVWAVDSAEAIVAAVERHSDWRKVA